MKLWDLLMLKLKTSFESLKSDYESHIADGHPFESDLPVGAIIIWFSNDIPDGWAYCDGSNGTPDLRNHFLICTPFTACFGDQVPFGAVGNSYRAMRVNLIQKL